MNIKKKSAPFRGVGTALITPFRDGEMDRDTLRTLVKRQYHGKVDALIVCGTTGESVTMTKAEKAAALDTVLSECGDKLPIVMGTGSADTRKAVRASREAEKQGADALLVVTPYYNKGTREGLLRHYLSIAEAVDLPLILYNVPGRTGVDLGLDILEKLAEHENIVAIKEASGNINRCADIVATLGDALPLYSGNDAEILPTLSVGGIGIISVISNLLPSEIRSLVSLYEEGRVREATTLSVRLLPLIRLLFAETNPAPIKAAMAAAGLISPEIRLPLTMPEGALLERIRKETESWI